MRISVYKLVTYLMALFVIFNIFSVFERAYTNYYVSEIALMLEIILFLMTLQIYNLKLVDIKKIAASLLPYYLIVIIYMFVGVSDSQIMGYMIRFIIFLPLMIFIEVMSKDNIIDNKILKSFSSIMVLLSIISLFFWLFGSLLHLIKPTGQIFVNWGGDNYYQSYCNLYFERQMINVLNTRIYRNCSVFCEAPMYSFCLVVSTAYEMLCTSHINKCKVLILSLAIISTVSTTGYISILLIYGSYLYNLYNSNGRIDKISKVLLSLFAVIIVGIIIRELLISKSSTNSWITRNRSIISYWNIFKQNIFCGIGYLNSEAANKLSKKMFGQESGTSNSLLSVLAQGGILFFCIYFFPFVANFICWLKKKKILLSTFTIILFLDFCLTTCQSTYVLLLIMAILYSTLILNKNI